MLTTSSSVSAHRREVGLEAGIRFALVALRFQMVNAHPMVPKLPKALYPHRVDVIPNYVA
jgi:hypothetical protein